MVIFPWESGTRLFERALDVRNGVHEVVAANIANEETPGFRALHLPFKEALEAAMDGTGPLLPTVTNSRHIPLVSSQNQAMLSVMSPDSGNGADGNSVNLEKEMATMAENSLMYMAVAQFLNGRFEGWRAAIREGR